MKTLYFGTQFEDGRSYMNPNASPDNDWDAWEAMENKRFFEEQARKQAARQKQLQPEKHELKEPDMPAVCRTCDKNKTCKKTWASLCEQNKG